MKNSNKLTVLRAVFFDVWTVPGMIVSAVSLYLSALSMMDRQALETLTAVYGIYSAISTFLFDHVFFFVEINFPEGIKNLFLTYLLVGVTTFRLHSSFLKLGQSDLDRDVIDNFVYEHSQNIIGFLLNPFEGNYQRVQTLVAKFVCLFLWPLILLSSFGYTGVKIKDSLGDDNLAIVSSVSFRPMVIVQLIAVCIFAMSFFLLLDGDSSLANVPA